MIAEQVIDYLVTQGVGQKAPSGNIWFGFLPHKPDNVIVVRDESAPNEPESQGYNIDGSGVQVLVRDENQIAARNQCLAIHSKIAGFHNDRFTPTGNEVGTTTITTTPSYIGPDDQNRHTWVVHYAFRIGNETQHRT